MDTDLIIQLLKPDTLTIVAGVVLIVLAIVTPMFSPFFRAVKPAEELEDKVEMEDNVEVGGEEELEEKDEVVEKRETIKEEVAPLSAPKVSILLTPNDNAEQLTRHLDAYLSQDYPAGYEVIVVTRKGDHETDDILKRYAANQHIRTTFIPETSRYMPLEKLAVTIGVKAAKNEWVMLADICCKPDSDQWLAAMAGQCGDNVNLVMSHTRYEETTHAFRRFERLCKELYLMRETLSGQAYRTDSGALLFRKSDFMAGEGYRGNLKYLRGEYDFLVNKYATPGSAVIVLDRCAWLTEEEPTNKHWLGKHLFYIENRQHLERNAEHRSRYNLHQTILHANYLLELAAMVLAAITLRWLLLAVAVVAMVVAMVLRTSIARKALQAWDEPVAAFKIPFYELRLAWFALGMQNRYRKANKNDFISHKL